MACRAEHDPHGKAAHEPGAKLDAGKLQAGLLFDFRGALRAVAEVSDHGARKYSRGGWLSVPQAQERYTDALWRHLLAEGADADSGLDHLAHAAWNLLAILELRLRGAT